MLDFIVMHNCIIRNYTVEDLHLDPISVLK